jgi:acetoin utilization protein AcuB
MRIRDVMTPDPVTIGPNHSIGAALARMRRGGFRRLLVVEKDKLVGIITDRDLRLAMNSPFIMREGWYDSYLMEHIEVRSCMTPDPVTVEADSELLDAVRLMRKHKYGGMPVVENDELVGILTETDLLDFLEQILASRQEPENQ